MGIYSVNECQEQILNEVYFGYTPGIARVFSAFQDFRHKHVVDRKFFMGNIDADNDPDLRKFIQEVEREFGLYSFSFIIVNDDKPNMMTLTPFFSGNDPKKMVEITKTGIKFKKEAKANIVTIAPTGLLFNDKFTDEEMFAIFLHEVGHNFQRFMSREIYSLQVVSEVYVVYLLILETLIMPLRAIKDIGRLTITSKPALNIISKAFNSLTLKDKKTLYTYINYISGIAKTFIKFAKDPVNVLMYPINGVLYGVLNLAQAISLTGIKDYYGERFADNFPSYYGFGQHIVSANRKMGTREIRTGLEYYIKSCPIIGHLINIASIPATWILGIADCHPASPTRMRSIVNSMEKDLEDPRLSPKLKKELKRQIEEIEKQNEEFYKKAINIANPEFVQMALNKFTYKIMKGDLKLKTSEVLLYDIIQGEMSLAADVNLRTYELMDKNDESHPISKVKIK